MLAGAVLPVLASQVTAVANAFYLGRWRQLADAHLTFSQQTHRKHRQKDLPYTLNSLIYLDATVQVEICHTAIISSTGKYDLM